MRNVKGFFTMLFVGALMLIPLGAQLQADNQQEGEQIVNCNGGDSLSAALAGAESGTTIRVTGTCTEAVLLNTNGLTLIGENGATIDAAGTDENAVTIDGARDVNISGFTIENGNEGILAINDATFALTDTIVQENDSHAIELVRATGEFSNITSRENGRAGLIIARNSLGALTGVTLQENLTGLVVFSNSTVRLIGTNVIEENATQGITVGLGGAVFSLGSDLQVTENGAEGIFVLQDGNIQLVGGALEVSHNRDSGFNLEQNSSVILGIDEFGVPGTAVISENGGSGIRAAAGSDVNGSRIMPLTSRDNGDAGIWLDDGSSATISGATIVDNRTSDVQLTFGSRATLTDNDLGTIACDETALIRGDSGTSCPAP